MNYTPELSLEEKFAYEFAQQWRDEDYRPDLHSVDWLRFARILVHNRMTVLAKQVFARVNPSIPQDAQKLIREQTERYERSASKLGDALTRRRLASYIFESEAEALASLSVFQ